MSRTTRSYIIAHKRFWELDLLRTIAIIMMITFHVFYLLNYFNIHNIGVSGVPYGFWWWFPRATGGTFIFLAGVSLTIGQARSSTKRSSFMLRGLKIFAWGMGITLLTWLIVPDAYVRFGILHFFGIAFILAPFFLQFRYINLIVGVALMVTGIFLLEYRVVVDFPWMLWLGIMPRGFSTLDYWPLLPWFGLFLVGMFCGKILYPQGNRRFNIHEFSNPVASALTLPGRHPLVTYLVQWPIVIGTLFTLYPDKVIPYFPS